jgi:hypothetical protein
MDLDNMIRPVWEEMNKIDNSTLTYCNVFVSKLMAKLGYYDFNGKTANGIIEEIRYDKKNWTPLESTPLIVDNIVIAGRISDLHGHVCVLLPGELIIAPKWDNKLVPLCANIGHTNFWSKGVNWAFKIEPEYFLYIPKL